LKENKDNFQWPFTLMSVVNSLCGVGLIIEEFKEYPFGGWQIHPLMVYDDENRVFFFPEKIREMIPMSFSIKAKKSIK